MVSRADNIPSNFRELRSDYAAANESRFRRRRVGVDPAGSGADYHYRDESKYFKMMEYARDMDRNDAVVGQLIDRAVTNMVQGGFKLDTNTGDKALDEELWGRWHEWANDADQCDLSGELNFYEMEQLVPRQQMVDGDIVVLPVRDGPLEIVEAHRIRTPRSTRQNVVHGVLLDNHRKRLQYWVTKQDVSLSGSVARVSDITPYFVRDAIGRRQVFHVYNPKRVSMTRGVTALAPVFDLCGMFEDINFAKVVQQQIVSCFAIFRQFAEGSMSPSQPQQGARETEMLRDGSTRTLEGIRPGMQIIGAPGETLTGFSPAVPNPEFFDHVKLMLSLIGVNLGLPLILVLMDASETNFSGWRGAMDQAKLGFRRNQACLCSRFHDPVYRFKVEQWMAEDAALRTAAKNKKLNIFGHKWNFPTWPYIEPEKDARARAFRVRTGLTSPRRAAAEDGDDNDTIVDETIHDNARSISRAKKMAAKINAKYDDDQPVHWRDVLSLPLPEGITLALSEAEPPQPEPTAPPKAKGVKRAS